MYQLSDWLPTTRKEMDLRGWDRADVILFSGDAYVDHPSFGVAVVGRLLEAEGLRVCIVPQPDWHGDLRDFKRLGRPRLFFGISPGCMDSMVNKYTAARRLRSEDACFIGVMMGVMNVIPYAGPLMGGIASLFVGIVTPIEGMTIGYTLAVIAGTLLTVKGLDDFVLQPTLYSERVNAHPLEVFIVILLAGSVGGILGMLLAIPSYTVLRVFAKEFFSQYALVKKLTKDI